MKKKNVILDALSANKKSSKNDFKDLASQDEMWLNYIQPHIKKATKKGLYFCEIEYDTIKSYYSYRINLNKEKLIEQLILVGEKYGYLLVDCGGYILISWNIK